MAYPPPHQPLTRQQRFDEQDKADRENANQQQLLRIQQQRADADEENQAAQQQRIEFERQRLPLDLYSAQAQAEAQRANAQFQQQQQAEQLRTAPQREAQNAATLAATQQGTKAAAASEARAEELSRFGISQRDVAIAAEQQRQAYLKAQAAREATTFANTQTALPVLTAQNKATLAATQQGITNAKALAEQQAAAAKHAETLRPYAATVAKQEAENARLNADRDLHLAPDAQLKNMLHLGQIDALLYTQALQLPAAQQIPFVSNALLEAKRASAGTGTDTQKGAAAVAEQDAVDLRDFKALHGGVDPMLSSTGQKLFEEFKAQRAKDRMYNKEEEYYKLNPDDRNLIFGPHSSLSQSKLMQYLYNPLMYQDMQP